MADRVKAVAEEEGTKLRRLSVQAVQSRAYLYPLHGLAYFASHRALQKPFLAALLPSVGLGLATTVALFALLYLPQAAALAFTQGPFAAVSAALLVLNESAAVTTFLGKNFVVADALVDTFDATLLARGGTDRLVQEGRQLGAGGDPVARLGKIVKKPFERLSPNAIIRYVMYLPLNFIPVVGSVIFVVLQGRKVGPAAHERYFQLKGMKGETKRRHVEEYQAAYTSFGVASVLFEMVPFVGLFFAFTNTVGAALWAADMEKNQVDKVIVWCKELKSKSPSSSTRSDAESRRIGREDPGAARAPILSSRMVTMRAISCVALIAVGLSSMSLVLVQTMTSLAPCAGAAGSSGLWWLDTNHDCENTTTPAFSTPISSAIYPPR